MTGPTRGLHLGNMATLFEQWQNNEIGNFGSFQTSIFKVYQEAGTNNQEALANAFPDWFKSDPETEAKDQKREAATEKGHDKFMNLLWKDTTLQELDNQIKDRVIELTKNFIAKLPKEYEADIIDAIWEDLEATRDDEGLSTKEQVAFDYLDELVTPDPEAGE